MIIQLFFFKFHEFSMHGTFFGWFSMISRACGNPADTVDTEALRGNNPYSLMMVTLPTCDPHFKTNINGSLICVFSLKACIANTMDTEQTAPLCNSLIGLLVFAFMAKIPESILIYAWVKVFKMILEFRILRLTFHKSQPQNAD